MDVYRLLQTLSEPLPSSIPSPGVEQWNNRTIDNRWKKNKMNYEKLSIAKSANALCMPASLFGGAEAISN